MRLKNIVVVVSDIEKAKEFYKELFGLCVILEREGNVILTEGLVLQDAKIWQEYIDRTVIWKNHASILYFEEADMGAFITKLEDSKWKISYLNPPMELPGGQTMVRFYDPDGNLIEVRNRG